MPSNESPSFLVISGTTFDGTTVKATSTLWQPDPSPKSQPRSYMNQSTIGRLSYADLGQTGRIGQLVIARCDVAAALMTLTVRTENAAENTAGNNDTPAPNNLDAALYTRSLTPDWCLPFLMGPTDAITLTDGLVTSVPATVELMTVDLQDSASLAYLNALFATAALTPTVAVRIVTVSEVIPAFSGVQYILGNAAAASMVLTLPTAASEAEGTTLVVTRIGGGWIQVSPQGADTINGSTNSVILNDIGQITFTLRGGVWLASRAPITTDLTVTNAVADTTVPLPTGTGTTLVNVTFTARGIISLPALANVALGVEYLLQRTSDNAGFSPSRVLITTQAVGDTLNGLANGTALLGNPGSVLRLRRVTGGWVEVSDRQSTPTQVIAATVDSTLDSGWVGLKLIRATQAAAQTLTLPVIGLLNTGCVFDVVYAGTTSLTINGNGVNIVGGGSTGATIILGPNESGRLAFNGTEWSFVRSAPTIRALSEPGNRVISEVWNGLREFRCTQAAAQTMTLPGANATPIGMEAHFVSEGAGGLTVNGGGTNIIGAGASAATKAIAQFTAIRVVSNGTNWIQSI